MTRLRWLIAATVVLVPASIVADLLGAHAATFLLAAGAVVPLAGILGESTEQLAERSGPRVGGLLNATFGNAAELIIGLLLVARGEIAVVEASITGSILGNLLLVLGAALFAGGLARKELQFASQAASTHVSSMALAVAGIFMPTIYALGGHEVTSFRIEAVSVGVAIVLLLLYGASLLFSLVTHTDVFRTAVVEPADASGDDHSEPWPMRRAITILAIVGVLVAIESEILVSALEPAVRSFGLSKLWVGLILVPIVGNAAEHSTAITVAIKGQCDLAIDIAVGSSGQVALLVAPVLVLAGVVFGHHLTLQFSAFEIAALAVAVIVVALLVLDGLSNWLEGAQLIGVYGIVAVASFFLGKA